MSEIDEKAFDRASAALGLSGSARMFAADILKAYFLHVQPKPPEGTTRERLVEACEAWYSAPLPFKTRRQVLDVLIDSALDVLSHPSPGVVEAMDIERKNGNCTTESMWQAGVAAIKRWQ